MLLTRRTFVQSSLVASLAIAAEASHARWLLISSDPIRIGLAGLGSSAAQHLALYSAIPGVQIARIADDSPQRVADALRYLAEQGQIRPRVSASIDALLTDRSISAISLPQEIPSAGITLGRILSAALPVLVDVPPAASPEINRTVVHTRLHHRVADLLYSGAPLDLHSWLNRGDMAHARAKLTLERHLTGPQTRAVLIASLYALLRYLPSTSSKQTLWSQDDKTVEFPQASTGARIRMPEGFSGPKMLELSLLPLVASASVLSLNHSKGSMDVPIWHTHDAQSSLRTVIEFLNSVRTDTIALPQPDWATAASSVIDRLLILQNIGA